MSILGDRIKKERENLNLTREDLAKKIGVSYSAIAMYEQGNREPSNAISIQMCKEFGCSMDYLMGLIDNYRNPKEDLEKKLYALDLSEDEFNNLISIIKENKYSKYLTYKGTNKLFQACKLCAILNYDYTIPYTDELTQTQKEKVDILQKQYYETEKKILLSLDKAKIIHNKENIAKIPILGTVKAGYDWLAEENIVDYITLKEDIPNIKEYFALQVVGDSMLPLLSEGDLVIVHDQDDVENGQTAIVLINGEEATVKKVIKTNEGIELHAMNPYYPVKKFTFEEMKTIPVKIIGRVKEAKIKGAFE